MALGDEQAQDGSEDEAGTGSWLDELADPGNGSEGGDDAPDTGFAAMDDAALDRIFGSLGEAEETDDEADLLGDQGDSQSPQGPRSWKSATDEEIKADPKAARDTIVGLQGLTTQTRQEMADLRRQLETERAANERRLQTILETFRVGTPQPEQQSGPKPPASIRECIDPATGEVDVDKLEAWGEALRRHAQAAAEAQVAPITEQLTADKQRAEEARQQAFVDRIDRRLKAMERSIPHFRDPANKQKVFAFMQSGGATDPMAAYAAVFPREFAQMVLKAEQAKGKQRPQRGAVPPGGRRTGGEPDKADLDPRAREDALAEAFAKAAPDLQKMKPPVPGCR